VDNPEVVYTPFHNLIADAGHDIWDRLVSNHVNAHWRHQIEELVPGDRAANAIKRVEDRMTSETGISVEPCGLIHGHDLSIAIDSVLSESLSMNVMNGHFFLKLLDFYYASRFRAADLMFPIVRKSFYIIVSDERFRERSGYSFKNISESIQYLDLKSYNRLQKKPAPHNFNPFNSRFKSVNYIDAFRSAADQYYFELLSAADARAEQNQAIISENQELRTRALEAERFNW